MNDIHFNLAQGGLGRPLPGEDYISALVFYTDNSKLPSGFSTTERVKLVTSPARALSLGIKNDYSDATAATSTSTVTATGANGDTVTIRIAEPGRTLTLGVYTKSASEATADAVAAAIAAIINLNTATFVDGDGNTVTVEHGYTATADGTPAGELIITAPKKMGTFLNTKSPVFAENPTSSTFAITIGAFTGGTQSLQAVWYYHIERFFKMQPKGQLYVAFYAVPGTYTFTELVNVQNFANGKIRQFGVYKDGSELTAANVIALNAVCQDLIDAHKETVAVLGADISATTDLTTLPDMSAQNSPWVLVDIGQDGEAQGSFLFNTYGKSITSLGATLGALALAKVNESIAWVAKFNFSDGVEFDVPAIANGDIVADENGTVDENLLDTLEARGYTFLRKFVGSVGTYRNETRTAIAADNDYAYIENGRTVQKAQRGIYAGLLPALGAPVFFNEDGTLSDYTIEYFQELTEKNLVQMGRDGEISDWSVLIDPTQKPLVTGEFIVSVEILPVGVARKILVNIGFTVATQ